jgi:putative addiction module component (TIGR02574 family)
MTRVEEIRQQTNVLSTSEKAELAADLLESLPPILDDEDEGLAEAHRRDEEMDRDPKAAMTWDELRGGLGR